MSYEVLKVYAPIAERFPPELRHHNADATHYQTVATLPDELALSLLARAVDERWTVRDLRMDVRRVRFHSGPSRDR